MRPNETVLKVSSLLATPDEANQGQGGLIPTSTVGVNRAKQGQMGPGFTPPSVAGCGVGRKANMRDSREDGNPRIPAPVDPFALWEKVRMRVREIGNATKCNQMQPK